MQRNFFITAIIVLALMFGIPIAKAGAGVKVAVENTMSDERFWEIIDQSKSSTGLEAQAAKLEAILAALDAGEIVAFERAFQRQQKRAYKWDLWGAAYLINGGASDDGFEYFGRWLISTGRKIFEAAVENPDSLADVLPPHNAQEVFEFEEFAYVASRAWQKKTGVNPWKDPDGTFPYTGAPPDKQPAGTPFEEGAEYLSKKYPKLWAWQHGK